MTGLATTRVISRVHTRLVALHTPRGIIHVYYMRRVVSRGVYTRVARYSRELIIEQAT